jgi:hypothetical protein
MKIETNITPRKDGCVRVAAPSGTIVFAPVDGCLVADVDNPQDLAFLLALVDFCPADEGDHDLAQALIQKPEAEGAPDDEGDDLPDDEGDLNAALIEVPTEPKAKPRKK